MASPELRSRAIIGSGLARRLRSMPFDEENRI